MIKENISIIRQRLFEVCSKINQDPANITIVAVSKNRTAEEIREVLSAGLTDIGENKVQEALIKYNELKAPGSGLPSVKWHMVGHLQTNKVKDAVKIFDLIHSVDSVRLAFEIDKQAGKINKVQDVLIEIKTSVEASKSGLKADEAVEAITEIAKLKNINIRGLMTIAPLMVDPEQTRPYFKALIDLRNNFNSLYARRYTLGVLSMGMTDDFEVAIEEGASMIRIGRGIFEG
jgi:PLP dependent protein